MIIGVTATVTKEDVTTVAVFQAAKDRGGFVSLKIGLGGVTLFFDDAAHVVSWAQRIVLEAAKAEAGATIEASSEPAAGGSAATGCLGGDPEAILPTALDASAVPCGNDPCVRSSGHAGDCLAAPDDDGGEWTPGGNQRFGL